MKKYSKYVKYFTFIFIGITIFHIYSWNTYTKYVFPKNYLVGDIGRMSYQLDNLQPRNIEVSLSVEKEKLLDNKKEKFEIVTIGDSFSNGGGSGLNNYYQYYISDINKKNVLNVKNVVGPDSYLETIITLINEGVLEKWGTKYIIFETVEREAINRLSKEIDFNFKANLTQETLNLMDCFIDKDVEISKNSEGFVVNNVKTSIFDIEKHTINIFNNLNVNAIFYNIFYNFNDRAFSSSAYKVKLDQEFFSVKSSDTLLFYKNDLKGLGKATKENVELLNDNLNKLSNLLLERGIKFYFMPVVDKYNLYSKYIVNNSYPKSQFFELLRELPKEYEFIDTKKILREELEKGVKDLYYSDDTHWSYKASEAIFKEVEFE